MLIMSIKNKFTNLLFGEKPEEPEPARREPETVDEVPPELASPSAFSMSLLDLSEDHPFSVSTPSGGTRPAICLRPVSVWTRRAYCRRRWCAGS